MGTYPNEQGAQYSDEQGRDFTIQFDLMLRRSKLLLGNDFEANTKRLGLITDSQLKDGRLQSKISEAKSASAR